MPTIVYCNGRLITDPIEKANSLITIILQYSAARVTSNIYSAPTQAYATPLILKSLRKG